MLHIKYMILLKLRHIEGKKLHKTSSYLRFPLYTVYRLNT